MSGLETGSGSGSTRQPYPLSKSSLLKGLHSVASSHSKNMAGSICDSEDGAGSVLLPLMSAGRITNQIWNYLKQSNTNCYAQYLYLVQCKMEQLWVAYVHMLYMICPSHIIISWPEPKFCFNWVHGKGEGSLLRSSTPKKVNWLNAGCHHL